MTEIQDHQLPYPLPHLAPIAQDPGDAIVQSEEIVGKTERSGLINQVAKKIRPGNKKNSKKSTTLTNPAIANQEDPQLAAQPKLQNAYQDSSITWNDPENQFQDFAEDMQGTARAPNKKLLQRGKAFVKAHVIRILELEGRLQAIQSELDKERLKNDQFVRLMTQERSLMHFSTDQEIGVLFGNLFESLQSWIKKYTKCFYNVTPSLSDCSEHQAWKTTLARGEFQWPMVLSKTKKKILFYMMLSHFLSRAVFECDNYNGFSSPEDWSHLTKMVDKSIFLPDAKDLWAEDELARYHLNGLENIVNSRKADQDTICLDAEQIGQWRARTVRLIPARTENEITKDKTCRRYVAGMMEFANILFAGSNPDSTIILSFEDALYRIGFPGPIYCNWSLIHDELLELITKAVVLSHKMRMCPLPLMVHFPPLPDFCEDTMTAYRGQNPASNGDQNTPKTVEAVLFPALISRLGGSNEVVIVRKAIVQLAK